MILLETTNTDFIIKNLLKIFYIVYKIYDDERVVNIIYLDLQEALNKVPDGRLVKKKMHMYSIIIKVLDWVIFWLC